MCKHESLWVKKDAMQSKMINFLYNYILIIYY